MINVNSSSHSDLHNILFALMMTSAISNCWYILKTHVLNLKLYGGRISKWYFWEMIKLWDQSPFHCDLCLYKEVSLHSSTWGLRKCNLWKKRPHILFTDDIAFTVFIFSDSLKVRSKCVLFRKYQIHDIFYDQEVRLSQVDNITISRICIIWVEDT